MPGPDDVRRIALALPDTAEAAHFHLTSFRVGGKIFATLGSDRPLMLTLDPEDQANLAAGDPERIAPVPGAWGRRGSTFVRIETLPEGQLARLIRMAWARCAPSRLLKAHPGLIGDGL
jgi:hypothetical protein